MPNGDWIRLHRKLLDSQVFSDFDLLGVWVWCLLRANWKDGWFHGELIKSGEFATGKETGSSECHLSPSAWYRRIQTLESMGMISRKSNNRFTIITICQWETYQREKTDDRTTIGQQADNKRTTSGQQADTIEEGKEGKEGKDIKGGKPRFVKPTTEEVREYCSERKNQVDPQVFVDFYESKGWVVGKSPMKDWKASVRTWEKNASDNGQGSLDLEPNFL